MAGRHYKINIKGNTAWMYKKLDTAFEAESCSFVYDMFNYESCALAHKAKKVQLLHIK